LLTAVTSKISLSVSLEVEPPGRAASLNRMLPDAGVYRFAAPLDVLRQTDVDSEQSRHDDASLEQTSLLDSRTLRRPSGRQRTLGHSGVQRFM
jgi:hypothetical protein